MGVFILLTPGFPESENDTTCLPAFQQFALSVKKLYPTLEFKIISLQYPFERRNYLWNGIPVIAIGGSNKPGFGRVVTWIRTYNCIRKVNKAKKINGILSLWLSECSLIAKYYAAFTDIKHYMWLIGQDAKANNQYIKRIRPRGEKIIAMSDFLQEEFLKNHRQRPVLVAENGINEAEFPTLNSSNRTIDILGVGSLIPLKNYTLFIEIVNELRTIHPEIKAVIAGSGIEENKLKDKVKSLNLEDHITFKGLISHPEILDLMNISKIFLHTSEYEGNSTVLMEALYSGCETLSSQALANKKIKKLEILQSKEQFVFAIKKILQAQKNSYERVCFNTMDQSVKKIMDLFLTK